MAEMERCPRCGTPKGQWKMQGQSGVRGSDGLFYCSQSCAKSAESKISQAIQEVYLEDDVKGPSEEPASMEHTGTRPTPPGQVGHGSGPSGGTAAPRVNADDPEV